MAAMKRATFCLFLFSACLAADARPLKEMCSQFEPLRKLSDLKYVKPVVKVRPESQAVKPQEVVFTIEAKAGAIKVIPAADGTIHFPLTDALCAENPNVESNQPAGSLGMVISIDPAVPPVKTLDYHLLDTLRREWDTAIARQSFMYRMLAPSAKAFQVLFEPGKGGSAEIRLPDGVRRLAADARGELRIPIEPAWAQANPTIVLSDVPRKIGLAFKG